MSRSVLSVAENNLLIMESFIKDKNLCIFSFVNEIMLFLVYDLASVDQTM